MSRPHPAAPLKDLKVWAGRFILTVLAAYAIFAAAALAAAFYSNGAARSNLQTPAAATLNEALHKFVLVLDARSVSITTMKISGYLTLYAPASVMRHLYVAAFGPNGTSTSKKKIFHCSPYLLHGIPDEIGDCSPTSYASHVTVDVDVLASTTLEMDSAPFFLHKEWTVNAFFNRGRGGAGEPFTASRRTVMHTFPFDCPLADTQALYPEDSYSLTLLPSIEIDGAVWKSSASAEATQRDYSPFFPPLDVAVVDTSPQGTLNVSSSPADPLWQGGTWPGNLFVWQRPLWYQAYTIMLALVPLAFAFLFFHMLFLHRNSHVTEMQEFLVASVAGVFTVLPLRLILVPGDVSSLSTVDLILAAGVVSLLALCIGKYVTHSGALGQAEAGGGEPTKDPDPSLDAAGGETA